MKQLTLINFKVAIFYTRFRYFVIFYYFTNLSTNSCIL